jgi:hypothetical protein
MMTEGGPTREQSKQLKGLRRNTLLALAADDGPAQILVTGAGEMEAQDNKTGEKLRVFFVQLNGLDFVWASMEDAQEAIDGMVRALNKTRAGK